MSYKNYQWEVIAKDYNSPFCRNYFWVKSWFEQARVFGIPRVVLGIHSRENAIEYIVDRGAKSWISAHNALKEKVLQDNFFLEKLIDDTVQTGEETNAWTEENIFSKDLTVLSGQELSSLLRQAFHKECSLYAYGTLLPILDFQGFSFVEGNLEKILHKYVPEEYQKWYEIFTAPFKNSFSQDQEEDLLRLMSAPDFDQALKDHTNKYGWVYYVYAGPAFTEEQFLEFVKQYIDQKINPQQKLAELEQKRKNIEESKKEFFAKHALDDSEKFLLNLAAKVIWAKPRRKDYQSKSYYHIEKLQKEIARRLVMTLTQIRSLPLEYIERGLNGQEIDGHIANAIMQEHVCIPNDDGMISILSGKEATEFSETVFRPEEQAPSDTKELKGACACPGNVTGNVRIVNVPADIPKMNQGDILVSSATTPSIISAMKKAGAILTDEGGLTCHAAIVSRELNIPCVIGLKTATLVLKEGDKVEVNATLGIVKKIS